MVCEWTEHEEHDYVFWETECDSSFAFTDGGSLSENKFKFCPYCGGAIKESEIASSLAPRNDINKEVINA